MRKCFLIISIVIFTLSLQGFDVIRGERENIDLDNLPNSAYYAGRLKIKLHPDFDKIIPDKLMEANPGNYVKTNITALDELNEMFGVSKYKPLFGELYSPSSKSNQYRERHQAWGFHLWFELEISDEADVIEAVKRYSQLAEVEIAEPEYRKKLYQDKENAARQETNSFVRWSTDDPQLGNQWHYNNTGQQSGTAGADISLFSAWDIEKGHSAVIVSIQDDGIQYDHPDLAGNMWSNTGWNHVTGSSTITPGDHGTHVAGTVAAVNNNNVGVAGVAGGSGSGDGIRLMSNQVFTESSSGGFENAPIWAADNGAAISQNSWGYTNVGVYDQSVLDAIDYFNANGGGDVLAGGITIYAAGNDGSSGAWYPGYYSGAFSVAATNNQDQKSWYSNYDSWVDISAPGGETNSVTERGVLSTTTGNSYSYYQGTSMACPHTSGVAALIISYAYRNGVTLENSTVANILRDTTDDHYAVNSSYSGQLGSGRLNAEAALLAVDDYVSGVLNPATLSANSVSTSQIDLLWTKNAENNDVMLLWSADGTFGSPIDGNYYAPGQTIAGGGTVLYRGSLTSYIHSELDAGTTYYYKAFSHNASNEYSSGKITNATTLCGVIDTLPFTEDFDSSVALPQCWENIDNQGNGQIWQFGTHTDGLVGTTGNYAFLDSDDYGYGNSQNADLLTPVLDLSGYSEIILSFTHYFREYSTSSGTLAYSIDAGSSWTALQTWNETTANPAYYSQEISEIAGQSQVRFKWNYTGTWGYYWNIDDIQISGTGGINADFSADITTASIGQTVTLTDETTGGAPSSWSWNFGTDATPATANTAGPHEVTYSTAGNKTVSLTVDGSSTETKNDFIHVLQPPVFSVNPTSLNFGEVTVNSTSSPQTFTITNTGEEALSGTITVPAAFDLTSLTSRKSKTTMRSSLSYNIIGNSSQEFQLTFTPTEAITYADAIIISSNDPNNLSNTISISGAGVNPPTANINPQSLETNLLVGDNDSTNLNISNTGDLELAYSADITYIGARSRESINVYPQSNSYWTGSCNSSAKTENSLVRGYLAEDGWMKFDISQIPAGSTINSITFNGYVYDTYFPYWSITPVNNDPVTTDATTLFDDISAEATVGSYLYQSESSSFTTGLKTHVLGGNANLDFQNALTQGWFAIGIASRDNDSTYYINFHGWNEENVPFLTVDYTPPAAPEYSWLSIDGAENSSGVIAANQNIDLAIDYDSSGLELGSYQAQINLTTNDPNNQTSLIPVTLNITDSDDPQISVNPSSIDFGQLLINQQSDIELFTISNNGLSSLVGTLDFPEDCLITPAARSAFKSGNTLRYQRDQLNFTIAAGESESYEIALQPESLGSYSSLFTITSNDPENPSLQVNLSATVIEPAQIELSASSFSANLTQGESTTKSLTISNLGDALLDYNITIQNATRNSAGPDAAGYYWIDSTEPLGPEYSWVEISTIGTALDLGIDSSVLINLPFNFDFYNEQKTSVRISSNGYLTFGDYGTDWTNDAIPNTNEPNDIICPFWDDLKPIGNEWGKVYYYNDTTNNRLIIQYDNVSHYTPSEPINNETFQVILHPNGDILFQYKTVLDLGDCTIGIENSSGEIGLAVTDMNIISDGTAVLFSRNIDNDNWLQLSGNSGTLENAELDEIILSFSALSTAVGIHQKNLLISSNDPSNPNINIPVTLVVSEQSPPMISVSPGNLIFGDVPINQTSAKTLYISNDGDLPLSGTIATPANFTVAETESSSLTNSKYTGRRTEKEILQRNTISYSVEANSAKYYLVTFAPSEITNYSGEIVITHNADGEDELITVQGNGAPIPTPQIATSDNSLALSITQDASAVSYLDILNVGNAPLEYNAYIQGSLRSRALIINENFDSGLATGWSIQDGGDTADTWQIVDDHLGYSLDDTPFAFVNSDAAGSGVAMDESLLTPTIDVSSYVNLTLEFDQYFRYISGYGDEKAEVDVWDGSQWVNIFANENASIGGWSNPNHQVINIPEELLTSNFQLRFRYYDAVYDYYWAIDNVKLFGVTASPEWISITENESAIVAAEEEIALKLSYDSTEMAVGNYNAFLTIYSNDPQTQELNIPISLTVNAANNEPDWEVITYDNALATIYGLVVLDGYAAAESDLVGIFVGDECRAKSNVSINAGGAYVNLLVNCAGGSESFNFKLYNRSQDLIREVDQDLELAPGSVIGSISNRYVISAGQLRTPQRVEITFSGNQIELDWQPVYGAKFYRIERSSYPDSGFQEIGISNNNSFIDTSVNQSKYFYRVIAVDAN